jgi:hypothetical protein
MENAGKGCARTINSPVSLPRAILAKGVELEVFHAVWITRVKRRCIRGVLFLVFVMNDTPCPIDYALDFGRVTQLQLDKLT